MKSILVFSSVLFISIAAIFQTNNVVITSTLPNYAKPGESVDFKITVSKGGLAGFSKLQMVFPQGFEVEAIDVKGGTFSFIDQKLKIIWVSLPSDPKFSVSFKVKIKAGTAGSFPLEGQFSYIQNGGRSDANYKTNIFIADEKPAAIANGGTTTDVATTNEPSTSSKTATTTAATATEPSASNETTTTEATTASATTATSNANFEFTRSLSSSNLKPAESATVKLIVVKKGISGFGKITEIIPEGFTAEEIESNGAIFSVLNNEVRFLWMTLPASDSFEVSYMLVASAHEGEHAIKGSFSYVKDTKTRLNSTSATIFNVAKEEDVIANVTTEPAAATESSSASAEPTTDETTNSEAETNSEAITAAVSEPVNEGPTSAPSTTEETASLNTATEAAATTGDVSYRVQICATRKPVDKQYFVKNNQVNEAIYADMHDGWHKFTVGAFGVYGEARNHRENVKETNKITGPFVTAYNSGSRITVQEALMISKQQWIP